MPSPHCLKEFTRFQHEAEDTALWFVLDELKMYIACDRVEDTRWCGKWERSFKSALTSKMLLLLLCARRLATDIALTARPGNGEGSDSSMSGAGCAKATVTGGGSRNTSDVEWE